MSPSGVRAGCAWQKPSPHQVPTPASGASCHPYFVRSKRNVPILKGAHVPSPACFLAAAAAHGWYTCAGGRRAGIPSAGYADLALLFCVLMTRHQKQQGVEVGDKTKQRTM